MSSKMNQTVRKCFLCGEEDTEYIYAFNNYTFKNIYLKLLFRRERNFKYGDIEFPTAVTSDMGYHSDCYKKVTGMLRKYRDEFEVFAKEHENDEPIVRSERYSLMEDEDWRTRGGSIWTGQAQERTGTRVKCRATTCQLVQLVKFMEKHPELAISHSKPFPGSDDLWMELAEHINQFGPPKNFRQCKTTWRDLRKRAFAMQRGRNKKGPPGRNLYGMAPKIVSLITQAGGRTPTKYKPPKPYEYEEESDSASSSKAESPASNEQPAVAAATSEATAVSVKQERKGEQFVIRVMDKDNSQKNVFNRFTISDGHFENNIIVKEEMEERMQEEPERTETEVEIEPHDQGEMFPQPEAILGNMDCADEIMEEKNSVIRDLNDTLRKFLTEYKTRNALMRERIDLERARLQFDMEVYRSRQMEKRVIAVNANMTAGNVNVKAANVAATRVIAVNAGVNSNAPNCVNVATAENSSEVKIANTFSVNKANVAKEDNAEDNVNNEDKDASTNEVIENDNT